MFGPSWQVAQTFAPTKTGRRGCAVTTAGHPAEPAQASVRIRPQRDGIGPLRIAHPLRSAGGLLHLEDLVGRYVGDHGDLAVGPANLDLVGFRRLAKAEVGPGIALRQVAPNRDQVVDLDE